MKVDVLNIEGKSTGKQVELPEDLFGIEPNEHAMYLAVKQYLAHQRQGTHKSKERSEIKGSTKKIKRQKGTGTARFGDIKNPLFRGGGRIFGPRPHKYKIKLNDKVKRLAKISAFSSKVKEGQLKIVEDFTFDSPSTSSLNNVFAAVTPDARKAMLLTPDHDSNIYLSGRNLKNRSVVEARNVNVYQLLNGGELVISESAVDKIKDILAAK